MAELRAKGYGPRENTKKGIAAEGRDRGRSSTPDKKGLGDGREEHTSPFQDRGKGTRARTATSEEGDSRSVAAGRRGGREGEAMAEAQGNVGGK